MEQRLRRRTHKFLLVDRHAVVRAGLRHLLANEANLSILEAASSQEALDVCRRERPNLIILELDIACSAELEVLRQLVQQNESVKILVLSTHAEPIDVSRALGGGALGYISKRAVAEEFIEAVRQVSRGRRYIERGIAEQLPVASLSGADPLGRLTSRESDILRFVGQGKTYKQIAAALGVSKSTVTTSSNAIKEKLAIKSNTDLVRLAIKRFVT